MPPPYFGLWASTIQLSLYGPRFPHCGMAVDALGWPVVALQIGPRDGLLGVYSSVAWPTGRAFGTGSRHALLCGPLRLLLWR